MALLKNKKCIFSAFKVGGFTSKPDTWIVTGRESSFKGKLISHKCFTYGREYSGFAKSMRLLNFVLIKRKMVRLFTGKCVDHVEYFISV
jgi:hypothetical protein